MTKKTSDLDKRVYAVFGNFVSTFVRLSGHLDAPHHASGLTLLNFKIIAM
jgi:hypothetical protein